MTNLKLTIEGSATTLARVLAFLGSDTSVPAEPVTPTPAPAPAVTIPVATVSAATGDATADPMPAPTPAPAPSEPTTTPELDANGLPWDERIHSGSKKTKNDGTWVMRKGIDKSIIPDIEAELKASLGGDVSAVGGEPAPAPAPVATPAPPVPPMPTDLGDGAPQHVAIPVMSPVPMPIPTGPMPTNVPTAMPVLHAEPVQAPPAPDPVAPVQQPQAPDVVPQPVAQPVPPAMAMPTGAVAAQPEPAPAPTPAPVAEAAPSAELNGGQFMQHLTGQMSKKDAGGQPMIDVAYLDGLVAEIAGAFGQELKVITDIFPHQAMINYAVGALQRDGRWN